MRKLLLLIAGICCHFSCQNSAIDPKGNNLAYKEAVQINDVPRTTLTFADFEDGRCPEDLNCLWGGYATVDLLLSGVTTQGRVDEHIKMCLGECNFVPKDTVQSNYMGNDTVVKSFAGQQYRFILLALTPARKTADDLKKEHRQITLKIEKK